MLSVGANLPEKSAHPCECPKHREQPRKALTNLILECWQREYGNRPYDTLIIHAKVFRHRMNRDFDEEDFQILLEFVKNKKILKFEFLYVKVFENFWGQFAYHLSRLHSVSLINVDLPAGFLEILAGLAGHCEIRILRLTGNSLQHDHVRHLHRFLEKNRNLEFLDVGFCNLDEYSFEIIADGVKISKSLKIVDMSRLIPTAPYADVNNNRITAIIYEMLWNCNLVEVNLKNTNLDEHCIASLTESISSCKSLLFLGLGCNKIGPGGTECLFKAIVKSGSITGVDISNNQLGEKGGMAVAQYLPFTKIRYLDISSNHIPTDVMFLILATIKKSVPIRILKIFNNSFDNKVARLLNRLLEAKVILPTSTDTAVSYDTENNEFFIVPQPNLNIRNSNHYFRVAQEHLWPKYFIRQDEILKLNSMARRYPKSVCTNKKIVDSIIFDEAGKTLSSLDDGTEVDRCSKILSALSL